MTLDQVQDAITARAAAIARLDAATPRELTAMIESGETIRLSLESLQQSLHLEAKRLQDLKAAHLRYLR